MNKLTPLKIKGVIKFKFRLNIIQIFKSSIVVKKLMQVNQVLIRKKPESDRFAIYSNRTVIPQDAR